MKPLVSTALALALTTACASHQSPDRSRVATGISALTGVDAGELPLPGREWSTPPGVSMDDGLTIDETVVIALWNNAEFQSALASLGFARADLVDAGLLKNPILSLLFPWGPKQLEFTASWSIDALWQRPKRIAEAKLNAEAVAQRLIDSGLRLVAESRLAFLDAIVSERRLALATEQAEIGTRLSGLAQGRLRAGDISDLDARVARNESLRLEAARLTRAAARDLAYVRLRTMIGRDQDTAIPRLIPPAVATGECGAGADLLRAALAARPDVRAAELHVEAAGARAGLERARVLAFTASLDANARGTEGFEMGPGLSVELPVLAQNQGGRARAAAELEQASRRYLVVRAAVASEVSAALIGLSEARSVSVLLGPDIAESAATARRQAERLHDAGEISMLELLATRQRLLDLESTRVDAEFGVNRAQVRLAQAVGKTCEVK